MRTAPLQKEEIEELHLGCGDVTQVATEAMQHSDRDAGWRMGRGDSGLNLDPTTQTHRCAQLSDRA